MMRNVFLSGLSLVLALAVAGNGLAGGEGNGSDAERLKRIEKQLADLSKSLQKSFEAIAADIQAAKDRNEDALLKYQALSKRLASLEQQISEMRAELDAAKNRTTTSKSLYAPGETGTVMVYNRYPEEILVVLNGTANYRVAPFTTRQINGVPVGTVTYEIFSPTYGSQGIRRSTLRAATPLGITIQQ
jgi:seryl-tRNA synthetase